MKRIVIAVLLMIMIFPALTLAQGNALGLRFGGGNFVGAEVSFQTPFQGERLELDLGMRGSSNWNYWNLTGIYQFVRPIESGFFWYLGVGPSIGNRNYTAHGTHNDEGMFLAVALNAGVEYNFEEIPLQFSIDTRPELGLFNTRNDSWFGLALGIRYRF